MSAGSAVSVCLLTRDGMATLPAVLDAIAAQRTSSPPEVVAVDSGSVDGTRRYLAGRVDRLLEVSPGSFDHGLTRNLAVAGCRGDLVVLLVQDAVPSSPRWLAELTAPFARDPGLAGTFARQLPREGASRLARWSQQRWVAAGDRPRVAELRDAARLAALAPLDRLALCAFDNVCSCVRRTVWEVVPFQPAVIAEDLEWGRDVLLAGYRLEFVPGAEVCHTHERSVRYELWRTRLTHARLWELFGVRTIPTVPALVRATVATLVAHCRVLASPEGPRPGPREVTRALALALAWPLGQYLGGAAGARGRALTLRPGT